MYGSVLCRSDLPESYGMPFFFTVENGIVIDVLEKPMA
jgi:hypothetical protein